MERHPTAVFTLIVTPQRGAVHHCHPEYTPAQDAEHRKQPYETFDSPQPCFRCPTAGLQDLVEHLDFPSLGIPAQLLDSCRAARDRPVGDQLPLDGGPMQRLGALVGVDHRQVECRIALLLADGRQDANATVSQLDQRRLGAAFVITNFNAMHALDAGLLHFIGYRVAAVARQAIDTGPDKEMGAEFLGGAEQLIDVALAIADMDTPRGFAEQGVGLAHVVEPTDALLVLDRHACRIYPALERGSALELLP